MFAIAITLLILDVHLPKTETRLTGQQLLDELAELWPRFLAYFVSFAVVALFWVKHHVSFRYIEAYDNRLIVLNFLQLLVISFIPFPTSVLSEQGNGIATALYAITMTTGFLLSALTWWYATRKHLVAPGFDPRSRRLSSLSSLVAAAVFAASACIAIVDPGWARFSWLY